MQIQRCTIVYLQRKRQFPHRFFTCSHRKPQGRIKAIAEWTHQGCFLCVLIIPAQDGSLYRSAPCRMFLIAQEACALSYGMIIIIPLLIKFTMKLYNGIIGAATRKLPRSGLFIGLKLLTKQSIAGHRMAQKERQASQLEPVLWGCPQTAKLAFSLKPAWLDPLPSTKTKYYKTGDGHAHLPCTQHQLLMKYETCASMFNWKCIK